MCLKERLDRYRTDYFFQIDLKEKIYARMVIFSVFITASITANFGMLDVLVKIPCIFLTIVCLIWIFGGIILVYIIYNFICITNLKADQWVNSNAEMETYREILDKHFRHYSSNPSENEVKNYVDEQFLIYLVDQYSRCSSIYNENNIYRQKRLSILANCTYLLLTLTFIVSLCFIYHQIEVSKNGTKPEYSTTTTTTNYT